MAQSGSVEPFHSPTPLALVEPFQDVWGLLGTRRLLRPPLSVLMPPRRRSLWRDESGELWASDERLRLDRVDDPVQLLGGDVREDERTLKVRPVKPIERAVSRIAFGPLLRTRMRGLRRPWRWRWVVNAYQFSFQCSTMPRPPIRSFRTSSSISMRDFGSISSAPSMFLAATASVHRRRARAGSRSRSEHDRPRADRRNREEGFRSPPRPARCGA